MDLGFAVVFSGEQVSYLFRPQFCNHLTRVNIAYLRSLAEFSGANCVHFGRLLSESENVID